MNENVRAQTLDGSWELIGSARSSGRWPEGMNLVYSKKGPDTARFTLKRDPRVPAPDLVAFTPIEVERRGTNIWDGYVREARPGSDSTSIEVECKGWQHAGDDNPYRRSFQHSKLSEWQDWRSGTALEFAAGGTFKYGSAQVEVGEQGIRLGWPDGAPVVQFSSVCGVTLDLGPLEMTDGAGCAYVTIEMATEGFLAGYYNLYVRSTDRPMEPTYGPISGTPRTDIFAVDAATAGVVQAGAAVARRYVHIFCYRVGASGVENADRFTRIKRITVYAPGYVHGDVNGFGNFYAYEAVIHAASKVRQWQPATVSGAWFGLPHFALTEDRSPNEVIDAANAFHNYRFQLAPGRAPIFTPQPATPLLQVGGWEGAEFRSAALSSGDEVYNKLTVTGQDPYGLPLKVERFAGQQSWAEPFARPAPQYFANPSADVNALGWNTAQFDSITRDTSVYDTAPASLKFTDTAPPLFPNGIANAFGDWGGGGPLVEGRVYQIRAKVRSDTAGTGAALGLRVDLNQLLVLQGSPISGMAANTWYDVVLTLVGPPAALQTLMQVYVLWSPKPTSNYWIDSVGIFEVKATLPDKRDFTRAKSIAIGATITTDIAAAVGDSALASMRRTPMKGDLSVTARGGVRAFPDGAPLDPADLGLYVNHLIHFGAEVDPDTGALGRDGQIAAVTYEADDESAQVTIDSTRDNLEALLQRYAVVVGG